VNTEITERCAGWILYDGDCAFCRGWVARGYRILRRRGFKFATLQSPWVSTRFAIDSDTLMQEMRLILSDGKRLGGADALLEIARRIWWMSPFYHLSGLPGVKAAMRTAYRCLARNRHCLGRACQLPRSAAKHSPDHSITSGFYELP
jgi:predicted DCC family thiol-disulfide oxidoreductase YuxK